MLRPMLVKAADIVDDRLDTRIATGSFRLGTHLRKRVAIKLPRPLDLSPKLNWRMR